MAEFAVILAGAASFGLGYWAGWKQRGQQLKRELDRMISRHERG